MPESIQHKLDRVRRPRVQITYDVETLGSIVKTELPFVVGIMADLSGYDKKLNRTPTDRPPLKERKFVEIDRDNFDQIMEKLVPKVTVGGVELEFKTLEDFNPINVLRNVPKLKTKFESRTRLSNLLAKLDGNPDLQKELVKAMDAFLNKPDKTELTNYVKRLHPDVGAAGDARPDLPALLTELEKPANKQLMKRLKAHIVETYPNTQTPGLKDLAASLDAGKQAELKTYILTEMSPLTLDLTKLVAAVPDAERAALVTKIEEITGSRPGVLPAFNDLTVEQQTALKTHIATLTSLDAKALVESVPGDEKEDIKSYIEANLEPSNISTVRADASRKSLTYLADSLSDADRKELRAYILDDKKFEPVVAAAKAAGGLTQ